MKKHGCLWWLFIGCWWVPITLPVRISVAIIKRYKAAAKNAPEASPVVPQGQQTPQLQANQETHKVAGVSYRQDALQALGTVNPDYARTKRDLENEGLTEEWIYEYTFAPKKVELIHEPDNPYSENGNAVRVVMDGQHIGYIKSGSSAHVLKLIQEGRIQRVDGFIGGGRKKQLAWDDDNEKYVVEQDSLPFYARLTITKK